VDVPGDLADHGGDVPPPTQQLTGPEEIGAALDRREPVRLLLAHREGLTTAEEALLQGARAAGLPVLRGTDSDLLRMSRTRPPARVLALVGRRPDGGPDEVLAAGGAVWLLAGVRYPSNVGYVVRTAEVSGGSGVLVDASFSAAERAQVGRVSMGADRFLPVCWCEADDVLDRAEAAGFATVAVEDSGGVAPWDLDLTGDVLLVVGGERDGVPPEVLARCREVVRVPMAGFVPSYNLQAPVAVLAVERLRQLAVPGAFDSPTGRGTESPRRECPSGPGDFPRKGRRR